MRLQGEKGQSIVEFALILPILLILVCGIIDFGWLYNCNIAATNAAREAARYASIHIYDSSTDNDGATAWNIVLSEAPQLRPDSTTVGLKSLDFDHNGIQESVEINVTSQVPLITGFTSIFMGKNSITISASSIMKIEN
jgi:Flp pilus assembly protein TadG